VLSRRFEVYLGIIKCFWRASQAYNMRSAIRVTVLLELLTVAIGTLLDHFCCRHRIMPVVAVRSVLSSATLWQGISPSLSSRDRSNFRHGGRYDIVRTAPTSDEETVPAEPVGVRWRRQLCECTHYALTSGAIAKFPTDQTLWLLFERHWKSRLNQLVTPNKKLGGLFSADHQAVHCPRLV